MVDQADEGANEVLLARQLAGITGDESCPRSGEPGACHRSNRGEHQVAEVLVGAHALMRTRDDHAVVVDGPAHPVAVVESVGRPVRADLWNELIGPPVFSLTP